MGEKKKKDTSFLPANTGQLLPNRAINIFQRVLKSIYTFKILCIPLESQVNKWATGMFLVNSQATDVTGVRQKPGLCVARTGETLDRPGNSERTAWNARSILGYVC